MAVPGRGRTRDQIFDFLVGLLAKRLGLRADSIDVHTPFADYGLSSSVAVVAVGELAAWLGRPLPPTLFWLHPTIDSMSSALASVQAVPSAAIPPPAAGGWLPAAVVGIGCRYAGVRGPAEFWSALLDGRDLVTPAAPERLVWPRNDAPVDRDGRADWYGSFLSDPYAFDAAYFGISATEAARMDPQQRILAETTAHALDDAGLPADQLAGTETGVFVGISTSDYARPRLGYPDIAMSHTTGNAASIAANRLSYLYDLRGPSLSVDTACSSSLVALHLAARSLAAGECETAIVAGVGLTLDPFITDCLAEAGMMAADGRCKTFDAKADGYVRGEGCAVLVLKTATRAAEDRDRVYALLLGSAVTQDGRTNGLTAPSQQAQEDVVHKACRAAGVSPGTIQYVEAHGTGTTLGDPIEARALGTVLAADREPGQCCLVGSVKTNLGHLEAAAGITGMVKVALALHHGWIPQSLHFEQPSRLIPFDELPLRVVTRTMRWPEADGPRLAGVSSFGFGGTNAHAILSSAPGPSGPAPNGTDGERQYVVALSGRRENAVLALADRWLSLLGQPDCPSLPDLAYTSTARRTHHPVRIAITARNRAELSDRLGKLVSGSVPDAAAVGQQRPAGPDRIGFAFTGQGNQWLGMGRVLLRTEPVFRDALLRADKHLRRVLRWSPLAFIERGEDDGRLADTAVAQPTIFALQVALADLWRSWGIVPAAVVGHSVGQIAAAHVSGVLDLDTAARLVAARSTAMASCRGNGAMAVVRLPSADLAGRLPDDVVVAAKNSPRWTLLSGQGEALAGLVAAAEQEGAHVQRLAGEYAFHSPWMRACLPAFRDAMPLLAPEQSKVPFYSALTGGPLDGPRLDAEYWIAEAVQPVAFADAIGAMVDEGLFTFVELGPHPALVTMVADVLRERGKAGTAVGSLRENLDDRGCMLDSLCTLYARGQNVDWAALHSGHRPPAPLPLYPFARDVYRIEPPKQSPAADSVGQLHPGLIHHEAEKPDERSRLFGIRPDFVPPRTEFEQVVADMWGKLLGTDRVGALDDFFGIGGYSLLASQFVRQVRDLFDVELPLRRLMREPTVAGVASVFEEILIGAEAERIARGERIAEAE